MARQVRNFYPRARAILAEHDFAGARVWIEDGRLWLFGERGARVSIPIDPSDLDSVAPERVRRVAIRSLRLKADDQRFTAESRAADKDLADALSAGALRGRA